MGVANTGEIFKNEFWEKPDAPTKIYYPVIVWMQMFEDVVSIFDHFDFSPRLNKLSRFKTTPSNYSKMMFADLNQVYYWRFKSDTHNNYNYIIKTKGRYFN
jgi:hypothetical protein